MPSSTETNSTPFTALPSQKVLLVGNPASKANDVQTLRTSLTSQVGPQGTVGFEMLDRLSAIQLPSSTYNTILSSHLPPTAFHHPQPVLNSLMQSLAPLGTLHLTEPCLVDTATSTVLPPFPAYLKTLQARLPTRTSRGLISALKLAGFVEAQIERTRILTDDQELKEMVDTCWGIGVDAASEADAERVVKEVVEGLKGRLEMVYVTAKRPGYEVGKASVLSFGKRKAATLNGSTSAPVVVQDKKPEVRKAAAAAAVWTVNANDLDDDQELEDEDMLLDEDDLKPVVAADCGAPLNKAGKKKKACKDCSCGLAEELEEEENRIMNEVVVVLPKKKELPTSSCGSCYLGDAFRCGSCPYLGMPAFKPGEKVTLAGNLLNDDI
ncbi:Anamorsin [Chytridiales sp. JEL 0842]|nr:Anamorsin [Chytridiales sp. JEL 0842]